MCAEVCTRKDALCIDHLLQVVCHHSTKHHCSFPTTIHTALWRSPRLAAAMFVTADTLYEMQAQRPEPGGKLLLLFINPQWQSEGQVVSGGCGAAPRRGLGVDICWNVDRRARYLADSGQSQW